VQVAAIPQLLQAVALELGINRRTSFLIRSTGSVFLVWQRLHYILGGTRTMNQADLSAKIEQLSQLEVAETLKNLRIALQHQQKRQLSDEEVRRACELPKTPGAPPARCMRNPL
jgi:hypothetical protein